MRYPVVAVAVLAMMTGASLAAAGPQGGWAPVTRIHEPSPVALGGFGYAVAFDDGYVAASAPYRLGPGLGVVHLYSETRGGLAHERRLTPATTPWTWFGRTLALEDGVLAVGEPFLSGVVTVFEEEAGWTQRARIDPQGITHERFGATLALRDGFLAVGSPLADGDRGAVTLFERGMTSWKRSETIPAPGPGKVPQFGYSVALDGALLVVGAPGADATQPAAGAVYLLGRHRNGWVVVDKLLAPQGHPGDRFGEAVAVADGKIVVGAPGADGPRGGWTGAAYVFTRDGQRWTLEQRLEPADPLPGGAFGSVVAAGGSRIAVGAPADRTDPGAREGSVTIFSAGPRGRLAVEATLEPSGLGTDPRFGTAIALQQRRLAVGAPGADVADLDGAGAVLLFAFARADGSSAAEPSLGDSERATATLASVCTRSCNPHGAPEHGAPERVSGVGAVHGGCAVTAPPPTASTLAPLVILLSFALFVCAKRRSR
jgi:hypothetical protein